MEKTKYFYGNKISEYGVQHNRVDYAALAKSFDAVLCNDITRLFYSDVCGEYCEPEQVNGFIDNSDEISDLSDEYDELQEQIQMLENSVSESGNLPQDDAIYSQIETLQEAADNISDQIDELERKQDEATEIYQYYIISDAGYDVLKYHTNEIVYYLEPLDVYIWCVTHCGTRWEYVLTDIKIEEE